MSYTKTIKLNKMEKEYDVYYTTTKEDWDSNVELNNYIDNLYPPSLSYMIAFLFYTYIILFANPYSTLY